MNIRNLIAPVALSFSMACFGLAEATVTGDNLNVRKYPNGELVEQLQRHHPVRVVKEKDGWSQIVYTNIENGTTAFGWVSSDFLELAFEAETTECMVDPKSGQDLCFAIMEPDLQCNRQADSAGYSDCSIDIRYELSGIENIEKEMGLACEISLITKKLATEEWHTLTQSAEASHSVEAKLRESMDFNIQFPKGQPISYARVNNTDCELIYEDMPANAEPELGFFISDIF